MKESKAILSPLQRLFGEDFNPALLVIMVRKSFIWCVLIMLVTVSSSLLYLRYTPPTYEVNASMIVKPINTAQALDIQSGLFQTKHTNLDIEKDIQIMKSNVILDRVIDSLDLSVSYYRKGKILKEELYRNNPFEVDFVAGRDYAYETPINLRILSDSEYQLNFSYSDENWTTHRFGVPYKIGSLQLTVHLRPGYLNGNDKGILNSEYVFVIRNRSMLYNELRSALQIAPSAPTLSLAMRSRKPQKAADIVNMVSNVFIQYDKEKKTESATLILNFIAEQVDSISNELRTYEDMMTQFKLENGIAITSMEEEINRELKELREREEKLNLQLSALEYYRRYFLQYQDSTRLLFGIMDKEYAGLNENIQALDRLQSNLKELSVNLAPNNPMIINLRQQIAEMKNNILVSIANEQKKVLEEKKNIEREITAYLSRFSEVPGITAEYMRLRRLSDLKEKYFLLLLDKKSAFDISKAGYVSDYTILRRADVSSKPVFPNVGLIRLLGVVIGLIGCLMLIIIRYLLHHKILSVHEIVRYTDASILGVVPKYNQTMDVSQLVVNKRPKSVISECFRSMRTNLEYMAPNQTTRLLAVTSTVAGEGKTFIAVNMAGILALGGKKVVLLDFDLRKPQLHKSFNLDNQRGVSTLIIGKYSLQECVKHTEWENFDVITSGPLPPNPAEFIASPRTEELLEELKKVYDVLVIDTPPVGIVTDALNLIKKADVPIYLIRADYSSRSFLNNVNHLYHDHQINRLAIVLNDMGEGASAYSYNYGYGYGYGYGFGYGYGYGYHQHAYNYYTDERPKNQSVFGRMMEFVRSLF
ncbi:MAG: polysaccharide biosynthesis tyrosine autokinase [Chitinophagales bacterium]|nr:polysaccharide biosynthesis tyrosine autokinase [Chitinophagales bacterium]MDW8394140.1 polysaccharide biosynthesis tyrosine autokinase [Chitinophagales bacterium]